MQVSMQPGMNFRAGANCRRCHAPTHMQKSSLAAGRYQRRKLTNSENRRKVVTMGLFGLGLPEVAVVAGIAVLVFGPSKLPSLGKELGKSVKSFQTAAKEFEEELKSATDDTKDKIEGQTDKVKEEIKKK